MAEKSPSPGAESRSASSSSGKQSESTAREELDTTTEDEVPAEPRVTRARTKAVDSPAPKPRGRQNKKKQSPSSSPSPGRKKTGRKGKNAAKEKAKKEKPPVSADEDDSDAPGEYIPVQVGDTVLLDAGEDEEPYIALVSSVQSSQRTDKPIVSFTAQWYYKPEDVPDEVLAQIKGGVVQDEVFLSPHKDKNSIDAVIEICQVVSPEEYKEIQNDIRRGFREKGKTYFVCRYKFYPGRSNIKKALEKVENEAIRSGLGRPKPNIGDTYQAHVPEFVEPTSKPKKCDSEAHVVPWADRPDPRNRPQQMWSPLAFEKQEAVFFEFLEMVDSLRYATGNIVKVFRREAKPIGHVRGIILKSTNRIDNGIHLCLSTGDVKQVRISEICSLIMDDIALQHLYLSRFNVCMAAMECSKQILDAQQSERDAFRREVVLFKQLAEDERLEKEEAASLAPDSARKRRK